MTTDLAFEGQRPPFEPGNRAAVKHRFFAAKLDADDQAEIDAIMESLRRLVLSELDVDALQPLLELTAMQMWRLRRAYVHLAGRDLEEGGSVNPLLRHVDICEKSVKQNIASLVLEPQAAADLNLTMVRSRKAFDLSVLSPAQRDVVVAAFVEVGLLER